MRLPPPPLAAVAAAVVAAAMVVVARSPAAAQAESPGEPPPFRGQVVVLKPQDVDEVTRTALARVIGELTAARFQVTVVPLEPSRDPTPQVETVAPELSPVAAFAIVRPPNSTHDAISIWVSDRLGQRTTIKHVKLRGTNVSQDAEVLAVDAIELIRVSIAGLWPPYAHAGDAEPPVLNPATSGTGSAVTGPGSPPAQARPSQDRELVLGIGAAGLQDIGVSSMEWLAALDVMFKWPAGFAVRGQARGLGSALTLSGRDYGTARISRQIAMLGGAWVFWPHERVQSLLAFSFGAEHLGVNGSADDAQRARVAETWAFVMSAGVGASIHLDEHLAFGLEIDGILALPPVAVRLADTVTKSLSLPGILTNATLQARF